MSIAETTRQPSSPQRILPPRKIAPRLLPVSAAHYNALVAEYNELVEDIEMLLAER